MAVGEYKQYHTSTGRLVRVRIVREDGDNSIVTSGAAVYSVPNAELQDYVQEDVPAPPENQEVRSQEDDLVPPENQPAAPLSTTQTAGETPTPDTTVSEPAPRNTRTPRTP